MAFAAFGSLVLFPIPAHAEPPPAPDAPEFRSEERPSKEPVAITTVRLGLPFTGVTNSVQFIEIGGLSISTRFLRIAEAEVGMQYWLGVCFQGPSFTPRVGVSPSLVTPRDPSSGWNLRLPLLAGYTYSALSGGGCDGNPGGELHSFTFSTGLDVTHWTGDIGFNLRLLAFVGETSHIRQGDSNLETGGLKVGATFEVGLAGRSR